MIRLESEGQIMTPLSSENPRHGHLITLQGGYKILLERTNNISEQHFSSAKA